MKKIILILFLFFTTLSFAGIFDSAFSRSLGQNATSEWSFFSAEDNLKKLQSKSIDLQTMIDIEMNKSPQEIQKKERVETLLSQVEGFLQEITPSFDGINLLPGNYPSIDTRNRIQRSVFELTQFLDVGPFHMDTPLETIIRDFPLIQRHADNYLQALSASIVSAEKEKKDRINEQEQELKKVQEDIERIRLVRNTQWMRTILQISFYISVFIVLYIVKIFSYRVFIRVERGFSKSHQQALNLAHRWFFNILFVLAFLILFAAELVSFLPFLAILGTALGLALKDAIYSFIGWFVVGSKSGYQEGDFIETDTVMGRVYRITPLLTTIEEYGSQGFTGKIVSFPNKVIFDKNIKNWSHGSSLSLMTMDFLLEYKSNIKKAKEILMQVAGSRDLKFFYESRSEVKKLKSTYWYSDDDLRPQVHAFPDPRWIVLRLKVLVHLSDRISEQSRIMQEFIARVQKEKTVSMREV